MVIPIATGATYTANDLTNNDIITCQLTSAEAYAAPATVNSNAVTMKVNETPAIRFDKIYVISGSDAVQLKPVVTGDVKSYLWAPAMGLNDLNIQSPLANPKVTTTYHITVNSNKGCPASADVVDVMVQRDIIIPNTFTPNGDGVNDTWDITYLADYPGCIVKIYNRWGKLLYNLVGYNKSWNAEFKGQRLPIGTYYYLIDFGNQKFKAKSGWVVILR